MEYKFGFADIEHEKIDEVISMLSEYKIDKYIVGLEKVQGETHIATNGEHMHFVLHVDPKIFKNFRETLINRYNLCGKNGSTGRFFGFSKVIRDAERFKAYTCKDENLTWAGFEEQEIKTYIANSFKKKESVFDILMDHLMQQRVELVPQQTHIDVTKIEVEILRYHMQLGERICKSKLKNYTLAYMQLYMKDRFNYLEQIYYYTIH